MTSPRTHWLFVPLAILFISIGLAADSTTSPESSRAAPMGESPRIAADEPGAGAATPVAASVPSDTGEAAGSSLGRAVPATSRTTPEPPPAVPVTASFGSVSDRKTTPSIPPDGAPLNTARGTELLSAPLPAMPEKPLRPFAKQPPDGQLVDEILLGSPSIKVAEAQRTKLLDLGLTIKQRKVLRGLGQVLTVYRVPPQQDPAAFLKRVKALLPEAMPEYNQLYYLNGREGAQGKQYAKELIGLDRREFSGANLTIAMLDAAVNADHPALAEANLTVSDVTGLANKPTQHGTAIASLLVGRQLVDGALPEAHLLAVNIFSRSDRGRQRTRTDWWLFGLNELASTEPKPSVINMSFGGGYSLLLAQALNHLAAQGITLVAAVGNGGPESDVMFPASLEQVIGATAVDARQRLFRGAPVSLSGPALAAPGVDVWAADQGSGGYYASGTSFASPWVTAIMAVARQSGYSTTEVLNAARDLGPPGYDSQFGAGLINKL